ncbi:hypothetical protein CHU98_g7821, partial [Xylaria longipes]
GAQIRDKDFDGAAWAVKHDTSFKDLIANARRTRAQAQAKPDESGGENGVNGTLAASDEDGSRTVRPTVEKASDTLNLLDTERIVGDFVDDPPAIKRLKDEGKESEAVPI